MKTRLTFLTNVTVVGLVTVAVAIWMQWLSGDPAYPKFPPGPVFFIAVAAIVVFGARWWWTPLLGALISLLTTSGWFARLSPEMLRLTHPGQVGKFAAGIFIGTLLQIMALLVTDITGLAAMVQNFRRLPTAPDSARMACRFFGGIFVLMGALAIVGGARVDKYHNLMHLVWGASALGFSFLSETAALSASHPAASMSRWRFSVSRWVTRCWAEPGISAPYFCTLGTTSSTWCWAPSSWGWDWFPGVPGGIVKVQG